MALYGASLAWVYPVVGTQFCISQWKLTRSWLVQNDLAGTTDTFSTCLSCSSESDQAFPGNHCASNLCLYEVHYHLIKSG